MSMSQSETYKSPIEHVKYWANTEPERVFLRQPINRQLVDYTWKEIDEKMRCLSAGLVHLGLKKGDKVAILSKNCAEWFIADLAIMAAGMISIPIYPTANSETIRYVMDHSKAKAAFVGKLDSTEEAEEGLDGHVIRIGMGYDSAATQYSWKQLAGLTAPIEPYMPKPDDIFSIIYTSGSTGKPKGAVIRYQAFNWTSQKVVEMLQSKDGDRVLSYLPLAHITERCYVEGPSIASATVVYFCEGLDTFVEDLNAARPSLFISVPRLWSLFQKNVLDKLGRKKLKILMAIPGVSALVKSKIRKALGLNHARILGCGSAPVSPSLLHWYRSIGLNVSEAWGMTETCAYSTCNLPFKVEKIGTVGQGLSGCHVKLSDEGELLYKSEGLFSEYYLDQAATKDAFTEDGYFKTGDLATIDEDGFVCIVGRVKDNFKTAKGKFVSPVPIERQIAQDSFVELVCVVGSGLPHAVGLVQLSEGAMKMPFDEVKASLQSTLEQVNSKLESHEVLSAIVVTETPWTTENDILTPTLKIKRHVLDKMFGERVSTLKGGVIVKESEL